MNLEDVKKYGVGPAQIKMILDGASYKFMVHCLSYTRAINVRFFYMNYLM